MLFREIINIFKTHSVSVFGAKGSGKDVLFGNVIIRRNEEYMSNTDYGGQYIPYRYDDIDMKATCHDLIKGTPPKYIWPHNKGVDIYLSDCGIYFPAQYCNELNKAYPSIPIFMALSRHVARNAVHTNTQALNRTWDKIREQSDVYILCEWICKPLLKIGIALQKVIIYDKYESAVAKVKPCRISTPLLAKEEARLQAEIYQDNFYNQHGSVKRRWLLYVNKSKHNTYFFEELFKNGGKNETNKTNL